MNEPGPSSVVLTEGERGTAWQRWASDGRWHSTTGRVVDWAWLQQQRRPVIVIHNVVTGQSQEGR